MSGNDKNIFGIYYLNVSKVYEIAMMINNHIPKKIEKEQIENENSKNRKEDTKDVVKESKEYLATITGTHAENNEDGYNRTSKMVQSLDIQTTKSILLRQIVEKCKRVSSLRNCEEGDLIRIDNIKLKILNEDILYQLKVLKGNTLKGLRIDGIEISNIISSMLQDYSYILYANIKEEDENKKIVIKIPMELENEFESKYGISDLLIGSVSIIGIYKGSISEEFVNSNTFTYLYELGQTQDISNKKEDKIFKSDYTEDKIIREHPVPKLQEEMYEYIDVVAVIQNIIFNC